MADSVKEKKNLSRYSAMNKLVNNFLSLLNEDNSYYDTIFDSNKKLTNESILHLSDKLNDILKKAIACNNNIPIVNEENYGITKKQQLEKADEYFKSILSKIDGGSDLADLTRSVMYLKKTTKSPYSIKIDSNRIHPNILTNVAWYIANNIQPKDAKIYSNNEENDNESPFDPMRNINDVKNEYVNLFKQQENKQQEEANDMKDTIGVQGKQISSGQKLVNRLMSENSELREVNEEQKELIEKLKIPRSELNDVKSDIHKLSTKNQLDLLNDIALTYAADPSLKQHIGDIRKALKADKANYNDNQINYIVTKALSENDRYLKTMAANPDLFDRDMSQDTIQKENEQFQSKLRQQNLRYILPKFIERRDKLAENTLNPELLKGAFAI